MQLRLSNGKPAPAWKEEKAHTCLHETLGEDPRGLHLTTWASQRAPPPNYRVRLAARGVLMALRSQWDHPRHGAQLLPQMAWGEGLGSATEQLCDAGQGVQIPCASVSPFAAQGNHIYLPALL